MKIYIYLFLVFSLPVNLFGQQIFSESDVLGKYYWNDNLNQVGKTIIIFKKNGKYIEKINKYKLGKKKRIGIWKLNGDSIEVTYFYQKFEGRIRYDLQFNNFKFLIDQDGICRTDVYMNQDIYYKFETCYKKKGNKSNKYPRLTKTIVDNPGYQGPWRKEKKE